VDGSNALLVARYRSKKNPLLVWSGRGRMARWLVQEMKETGLGKDAFRVV
jgi:DNA-binding protein H-NS